MTTKPSIALDDDNFRDYFSFSHAEAIIKGAPIPGDGFDPDGPEVARLVKWVAERNTHPNSKVTWTLSEGDAVAVLNLVAGWDPTARK